MEWKNCWMCCSSPFLEDDSPTISTEDADHTPLIHGPVKLKRGWRRQKRHLFLFSDVLIISNSNYKKIFKIKNEIPLTNLWVADCVDKKGEPQTSARKSFLLGWPMVNFVATFCSSEVKEQWRSSLQRYITLAVEKDHSKSIPLQISTKDCKKSSYSVTVTISNSDTANDIIHKALSMLGITDSILVLKDIFQKF
ncbi:rho GTPase-activating protein 20-like isoform X3 [Carlito syrichta]|uniref:Rho GTPase-activating protein 20-like isoform X3 n=1 Tax=Carlito syrichta TaxID=1868482 RepID=A0A1U7UCK4_CARSF|nr:rho GTPase-activating protein 20-like isoform X3 [Carlito syrichta]